MLGAAGYLSKGLPLDETLLALRTVLAGGTAFPAPTAAGNGTNDVMHRRIGVLSGAQLRVLIALAGGRLNKQIAGELGVTEATIKAHLTAIFRKLGVNNRTQAILAVQPLLGRCGGRRPHDGGACSRSPGPVRSRDPSRLVFLLAAATCVRTRLILALLAVAIGGQSRTESLSLRLLASRLPPDEQAAALPT